MVSLALLQGLTMAFYSMVFLTVEYFLKLPPRGFSHSWVLQQPISGVCGEILGLI